MVTNIEALKIESWYDYIINHLKFTGCLIDKYNNIAWFKNGEFHREDGPAIEYDNGDKYWYLNDTLYNEQEWLIAMRKIKLERVLKKIT